MGCPTSIVPGFAEGDKASKLLDVGARSRIEMEMSKSDNVPGPTFKVKKNYNPKNTKKAYKLFKFKDGKLYPLYVDAKRSLPIGVWLAAESGELQGGKVKSSIGQLAYRPGWHSGSLPLATHIGGKVNPQTGERMTGRGIKPTMREEDTVWAEVEVPADKDWQSVANSRASRTRDGRLNLREAHITDQIPHDGYYNYKTNANMTGSWLISGELKVNKILTDEEVRQINSRAGTSDLPRNYELPYFNRS